MILEYLCRENALPSCDDITWSVLMARLLVGEQNKRQPFLLAQKRLILNTTQFCGLAWFLW